MFLEWYYNALISWQKVRILTHTVSVWTHISCLGRNQSLTPAPVLYFLSEPIPSLFNWESDLHQDLWVKSVCLQVQRWRSQAGSKSGCLQILRWSQAGSCHNSDESGGKGQLPGAPGRMLFRRPMELTSSVQHRWVSRCQPSLKRARSLAKKVQKAAKKAGLRLRAKEIPQLLKQQKCS